MKAEIKHGTYSGYGQEQRAGVPHCDACKAAAATYHRGRRQPGTAAYVKNRSYVDARHGALRKLVSAHRAEYRALLDAEYEALATKSAT